ncbi:MULTISPECIES: hypothetical protein [Flavobacteriaceae]|uniref:hypothetical protein n=1 Tax=Flavobacteriaceae TaxID=49546 RepID=UPI001491E197|nr:MULTISPECIES: hypothetical protein [Allomuricauda]MDC6366516.1 hypothetical protein [Muricauda sp. AC10]
MLKAKKIFNKTKGRQTRFFVCFVLAITIFSCEDGDKNNFDDFENGGFVRLATAFPTVLSINTLEEIANFSIPATFEAPDENVASYSLQVFATISGTATDTVSFGNEINSFPTTINITATDVASALGIEISDIGFGDTFTFLGTAVNDKGTVYGPERLSFNTETKEISGGNNTNDLFDEQGYRQAFNFGFAIPCPPEAGEIDGDWIIDMQDLYGDGWDGAFVTVTIDGVGTNYTVNEGSAANHVVTVPAGTQTLVFSYTPGSYEEEHVYTVEKPDGTVLGPFGPNPPLCIN